MASHAPAAATDFALLGIVLPHPLGAPVLRVALTLPLFLFIFSLLLIIIFLFSRALAISALRLSQQEHNQYEGQRVTAR